MGADTELVDKQVYSSTPNSPAPLLAAHVLLVDSHSANCDRVRQLLPSEYRVAVLSKGEEALDYALANRPDVLLLGAIKRGRGQFNLLRALREDPHTAAIPVLAMSAEATNKASVESDEDVLADDYLHPPFSGDELIDRIESHVAMSRLRNEFVERELRLYGRAQHEIHERAQIEVALRESEERQRQLIEGLPAAVYTCDAKGRITMFNAAAAELWGRRPILHGDHWSGSWRIYHSDGTPLSAEQCPMAIALREGKIVRGTEIVVERADGSRRCVIPHPRLILDSSGAIVGAVNMLVDITDHKLAEAELAATKSDLSLQVTALTRLHDLAMRLARTPEPRPALQAILETLVEVHDADMGLLSIYDPATGLLHDDAYVGFEEETLRFLRTVKPDPKLGARGSAFATKQRVIVEDAESDPRFATLLAVTREAGVRALHSTPILTRSGEILGVLSVQFRTRRRPTQCEMQLADLCARHAADAIEAANNHRAVRESEARFRTLTSNVPVGIFQSAPDGEIIFVNEQWCLMAGLTPKQASGSGWFVAVHPEDRRRVFEGWQETIVSGEPSEAEFRFLRPDGGVTWVQGNAIPLHNADGVLAGYIGTVADITARKRAEITLRENEEALKDADRRKDEFLAVLAHELRNPLAPIRTGLELMRLAGEDQALNEEVRGTMERQVQQMVRLIDDLLDVSRITRGTVELRKSRVELSAIVATAVETARPVIDEWQHRLSISLPPEPIILDADPTRLAQAISNLLNNAAKYMHRSGTIDLAAHRQGQEVVISVKDSGIGIPPQMLESIFDMFTQVDRSLERSHSGLGIGLTLVKRLIGMHGGSIAATSAGPNLGSEFTIRLPVVVGLMRSQPPKHGENVATSSECRVLVVDDNEQGARVLAMLLTALGNDVRIAHDGLAAVDVAAEFQPDLVLLDIGMPKLNGYEAARRIRELPWAKDALLVALTGWGQDEDKQRSRAAGFDHHFVKPVEPAVLKRLLAECQPRR